MPILPDWMIERDIKIEPFDSGGVKPGKISYGLSSNGYDLRVGYKFKVFKPYPCTVIDPKNFDERMLEPVDLTPVACDFVMTKEGNMRERSIHICSRCNEWTHFPDNEDRKSCKAGPADNIVIPPHSFILAESLEYLEIPRDILVVVVGKSTLARCSLIVNVTPLEPEWKGKVTIEISNTAPLPTKVYVGEGICQCLFFRSEAACKVSYADRKGIYNNQKGLTLPKIKEE